MVIMAHTGAVAEWLNAHDSKSCIGATLSRVQIPSAPPGITRNMRDFLNIKIIVFDRFNNCGDQFILVRGCFK